jgi:hypothetical protein
MLQNDTIAKTDNTKSAIIAELMAGSSPNFYHRYG